jgi:ATP-dependent helicase/nuclease subunit B
LSGARVFKSFSNHKVLFTDLEDASIGGYQNIICSDLNEGSMPRCVSQDPWMSPTIRKSLGLPDISENIGISWYYFDNILNRERVLLTRSVKLSGADTIPSRFWLDCNFSETEYKAKTAYSKEFIVAQEKEWFGILPNKISATNLELLIRNPYGFYAKNILNLRKLNDITEPNNLARFGNFLHKVFQDYTNSYKDLVGDRYIAITKIMEDLLQYEDSDLRVLWKPKITQIIMDFIKFDEERRDLGVRVFSEIQGEMEIEISGRVIKITAIADRVEVDNAGNIYILDYKTGTLPSKSDVNSGIAVQMIVETLIANAGGFKGVSGKVKEVIYVKIASRFPYIETVSFAVEEMDLKAHYDGLKNLLEYYDGSSNFLVNENPKFAPKYDDYKHLARKYS